MNKSNHLHKVEKPKIGDLVKIKESYLTKIGKENNPYPLWRVSQKQDENLLIKTMTIFGERFLEVKEDDVFVWNEEKEKQRKIEEMKKKNEERKQKLISSYSHLLDDYDGKLDKLYDELDEYRRVVENNGFDGGIHDCYSLMEYIDDLENQ